MAKYINTAMAIEALQKGLDIWWWNSAYGKWDTQTMSDLTHQLNGSDVFAIGEKPTSPPRKMIEIDGVVMPAPIMRVEDLPLPFWALYADGSFGASTDVHSSWTRGYAQSGFLFATEADAIAARDARKLILEQAMERAK